MITLLLVLAAAAAAEFVGWWLLALVAFIWGVVLRRVRWPALRIGAVVAGLGVARLGWMAWEGARVGDAGALLAGVTGLPASLVWALAILLPALLAGSAATLGASLGRKVLFG
jgi:hypothetical protein